MSNGDRRDELAVVHLSQRNDDTQITWRIKASLERTNAMSETNSQYRSSFCGVVRQLTDPGLMALHQEFTTADLCTCQLH
jgi:hypothetical protein